MPAWALALCLAAAFATVFIVGVAAWHKGSVVDLVFKGCDSFCYSEMAASIRTARASGQPVDYFLRDDQTQFLIQKFQETGLPDRAWRQAVAPHGYHYFKFTKQVGPQYPPGTPWALSFFRPVGAIHDLNRLSIGLIALTGLGLAIWCAGRRLIFSCLVVALATYTYLSVLTWVDLASFSINVTLLPLFVGIILAWIAREGVRGGWGALLAFLGGIGVGLAMEDRVASILLLPSMLLFFLPRQWGRMMAHLAGLLVGGVLPVMLHNKLVTGSFFLPTYDTYDTDQTFRCIWVNLLFYIAWWYQTSIAQVAILTAALLALVVLVRSTLSAPPGHWRRWCWERAGFILTAPSAFVIAAVFFLTHVVKEGYYLTPSMLTVALVTALLFVSLEIEWRKGRPAISRRMALNGAAVGLAAGGVAAAYFANLGDMKDGLDDFAKGRPEVVVPLVLPEEMRAANAWIWADMISGTIRLETGHPAFRLYAGWPETHRQVYGWVKARGEPQYLVEDSETMRGMLDEAHRLGWKTMLVGYVLDAPCYRMIGGP